MKLFWMVPPPNQLFCKDAHVDADAVIAHICIHIIWLLLFGICIHIMRLLTTSAQLLQLLNTITIRYLRIG
jgi:uncharacterized membrane protein YccF (DUF307 family)